MDAGYFLYQRTKFIRAFYDGAAKPFQNVLDSIELALPPFDDPPYSEDGEPAFIEQWLDAKACQNVLGLSCLALLSDSLKLYLETLRVREIDFKFARQGKRHNDGFLSPHMRALAEILEIDWRDCSANLEIVEQVVLARNRAQHGTSIVSLDATHDADTLSKYPEPFFCNNEEWRLWSEAGGSPESLFAPNVSVTREALFTAIDHIEKFSDFVGLNLEKAATWRTRNVDSTFSG